MSSDDIVTRLREYEAITDNAYVINALVAAADEIERLRAQLNAMTEMRDEWRTIAKNLGAEDFSYVEPE